jgi:hypothetical protein
MLWRVDSVFAKVATFTTYKLTEPVQASKPAPWFGIGPLRFRVSDSPHAGLLPILKNQRSSARIGSGHPESMSQHVNRMRKEPKAARQLKKHEQALRAFCSNR